MKKVKVKFKANLSGYKTGEIADVNEDFIRRAGDDVEVIHLPGDKQKEVKVLNKAMNKKQLKTK